MDKKIELLILDDEENILKSLKRLFADESFDVAVTKDVNEALGIVDSETSLKVVMSDQRMPGASGVEFLSQVREKKPDVIRILFTGYADIQAAEDAVNKGQVYRFISKPWDDEGLIRIIREAIQHHDLIRENKRLFDITRDQNEELKEKNRKLKVMYESQRDFTSTVSHELRTPLASMKASIDMLFNPKVGQINEKQNKYLDICKRNVDRLHRLINDILDLSKLESGKESLVMQEKDINHLLEETAESHKEVAKSKGLFIKTLLDQRMLPISFNEDKMVQVISNLVNNAIKFTENGGITLSSEYHPDKEEVRICVEDTGPGIRMEDRERLFQKFEQLGDSRNHVSGTGLGLAICMEIVKKHKGKIWVESEPGKGSRFWIELPIT